MAPVCSRRPGDEECLLRRFLGRVFMKPTFDDPFSAVDEALRTAPLKGRADAVIVDIHAEATSEKNAMGHFLDGRASLVVGSHTHIPTADGRILPHGTAYLTDAGMCGVYQSVIGFDQEIPLGQFRTGMKRGRATPATGEATVSGLIVTTSDETGLAVSIEQIQIGGVFRRSNN